MKKTIGVWAAILLLAAGLRFWGIGKYPAELDMDEAANGYYAYSMLHGGRDEYGNLWPVYFPSNGDYKLPGYVLGSVLWVKLGGLGEATTRMASAVAGVLGVALLGILGWKLTGKPGVGRFTAAAAAIMPWHVWLSRGAYEVNLGLTLLLAMATGLLYYREGKKGFLWLFVVSGIWAEFTYPAVRWMVICLALVGVGWAAGKKKFAAAAATAVILAAGGWGLLIKGGSVRTGQTVAWAADTTEIKVQLRDRILEDGLAQWRQPIWMTRAFHNKIAGAAVDVGERYLAYFDPGYLFIRGDVRNRFNFIQVGPVLLVFLPLLLAGLANRHTEKKLWWAAIVWWLAGTLPAAVSNEKYHILRHLTALPGIVLLVGYGGWMTGRVLAKIKFGRWLAAGGMLLVLINMGVAVDYYLVHKNYYRPWYSDGGTKEMVQYTTGILGDFKGAAISRDQYIYWAFYNRIKPDQFRQELALEEGTGEFAWDRVAGFRNLKFKMSTDCPKLGKRNVLYICRGTEVPQNAQVLKVFRFNDDVPAYTLIRFFGLGEDFDKQLPERLTRMVDVDTRFGKEGVLPADYPGYWL